MVELRAGRLNEALCLHNEATDLVERSSEAALKGAFHNQLATLYEHLGTKQGHDDCTDRALIEYAAASFHFERAGNRRYLARVENNLGYLFSSIGRYREAHSHLDRARLLFLDLKDVGTVAQVDDTRARTLLAEGRIREAERFARSAVQTLEKGDEQALLAELSADEIAALAELSTARRYEAGQRIISAGEPANSLFFLQSGMVSVKLPSGVRLASLGPGMEFGEMAILEHKRSADVWADTPVKCLELPLDAFADYRKLRPQIALQIMRNLSALLARRLILANAKVDLLSAY